jgi:hypothetical protein
MALLVMALSGKRVVNIIGPCDGQCLFLGRRAKNLHCFVALARGTKSICHIVWDIIASTKSLSTLHIIWNRNVRSLLYRIQMGADYIHRKILID